MKTLKALTLPALLVALLIPASALAQPDEGPGFGRSEFGRGPFLGRLAEQLEITEEQRAQLDALHKEHRDELEPLMDEARAARQGVGDLMKSESFDEEAIRAAAQLAADTQVELTVLRARHREALRSVLTTEQLEELASLREERRDRRPGFRGRPGRGGGRASGRGPGGRPPGGFGGGPGSW